VRAIYSFIIDGAPQFEIQTRIILTSLIATGVSPGDIVAHCTPRASARAARIAQELGVMMRPLEPFLDGKYCNKLNQLPTLLDIAADLYVLCDTDLAFADRIDDLYSTTHIRARQVGRANPPLDVLANLLVARGLSIEPRIVRTLLDEQPTWSVNCNGGLYLVPRGLLEYLSAAWRRETEFVFARPDVLGEWRRNADQLGFAIALLSAGLDVAELPVEVNFPLLPAARLRHVRVDTPRVLHYHVPPDSRGLLRTSGHPGVDRAVAKINAWLAR
jgi:hypothetical protein